MGYSYQVGTMFTLQPKNKNSSDRYLASVKYVTHQHICIELPVRLKGEGPAFIPIGTELEVSYIGKDNVFYKFTSSVISHKTKDEPVLYLSHPAPEKIERKQRRNYFRVPTETEVHLYPTSDPQTSLVAKTVDLSGGGMSFMLPDDQDLQDEETLRFKLPLQFPNGIEKTVHGSGQIKRVDTIEKGRLYAIQFTEITEGDRQTIIQYCFNIQLKRRGKRFSV